MDASQLRQRPRSRSQDRIGMLSYPAICVPQESHIERGPTIERPLGTRSATTPTKLPVTMPPTNASEAIGNMSAKRLPLHVPGRLHRVEEVRWLLVAEAIVVVVVLEVAVAPHRPHRAS